tara:strand:- start:22 stop:150 length:129 start_codon:yes stop_codon:yes gene_type:complete
MTDEAFKGELKTTGALLILLVIASGILWGIGVPVALIFWLAQ